MEASTRALDKLVGGDVDNTELERTVDDGQQDHQAPGTTGVSPWGRLVPVGGSTGRGSHATGTDVVELAPDQPPLLLGRSPDCDPRCRFGDKRISARHCRLYRERDASGHYVVVLEDLSSNGTFVNGTKVGKGKRRQLSSGDEIALTNLAVRGVPGEDRVCYLFQAVPPPPPPPRAAQADDDDDKEEASTQEIIADEDPDPLVASTAHAPTAAAAAATTTTTATTAPPAVATATAAGGTDADAATAGGGGGGGGDAPPSATTKRKKEDEAAGEREADDESERDKKKLRKIEETYEDNMVCGICQELLYKCVALFPCMHNFCACCYSEWRERGNKQCPQCRTHVQGLSKNHTICAIIESYIEANPEKARDPEELKEMDARSKLTDEMLRRVITYKGGKKAKSSYQDHDDDDECDDDDDDDEEEEDEGSEEDDDRTYRPPLFATPFPAPLFGSTFSHYSGAYRTICRQCGTAGPDGFKCPSDGAAPHHLCSACGQPFPDRGDRCPTPIKCELCDKPYCDLYWGCASPVGVGKFKKLSQHTFTTLPPASFNNNPAEQEIVLNYLTAKGKSVTELWLACLADADSGAISFNGVHTRKNVQSGQHACWSCAQYAFQNLVYLHRANMPPEDLPTSVTSRPDCHWGRNCRTQQHNVGHAKRFNHVCEQTRF